MESLSLLGIGYGLTKIVASIYRTLAATYSRMLDIVNVFNGSELELFLNSVVGNIYTLVGIFMLFRIAVSLLNYLVDPDKLNDKSVGGQQLVVHIMISMVLLLSLNSLIFPLFDELQATLLDPEGILYNLTNNKINTTNSNITIDNDIQKSLAIEKFESSNIFISNVYASSITPLGASFNDNVSNCNSCVTTEEWEKAAKDALVSRVNGIFREYEQYDSAIGNAAKGKHISICSSDGTGNNCYFISHEETITSISENVGKIASVYIYGLPIGDNSSAVNVSNLNGIGTINNAYKLFETVTGNTPSNTTYRTSYKFEIIVNSYVKDTQMYDEMGIKSDGYEFSSTILGTFISPSDEFNKDSEHNFLKKYGESDEGSSGWWAKKIEDEETNSAGIVYTMDWLMAIIVGLAAIVLLITICIDVVIRNLKLVILRMIAPIAVISYMSPKDKMLGTWTKMYIGTFFDLFIKLLAIILVPPIMMHLINSINNVEGLYKIIVVAGCLLFIKEAPKFISKVLGIENMAGSFGDAFKMVKTGLGIGAGAVAGGVAGAVSGFGAGGGFSTVAGGLLGGAFRGASGGAKGKYFEGAKAQIGRNRTTRDLSAKGVGYKDRLLGRTGLKTTMGMDREIEQHKHEAEKQNRMVSYAKNAKDTAIDIMSKGKADGLGGTAGSYRKEMDKLAYLDAARKGISKESIAAMMGPNVTSSAIELEYNDALKRANDAYEQQRNYIYVDKDANGLSFEDRAVAETFAKSDDDKIKNLKNSAAIELEEFGVNTSDYVAVKAAAKNAETIAAEETANANKISNSQEYGNVKAAQSLKNGNK